MRTIQNFQPDITRSYIPGSDKNIVVERQYGSGGRLAALIAQNPLTGPQVTSYVYGSS